MKKSKRHLYKRLPKYALGTMKPIDLGYQPGRGIGSARFETELNMSLEPETLAVKRSYIPNAIGKLTQYSPYVTEAVKDWTPASSTAASNTATNTMRSTSYLAPSLQNTTTATIMPQARALSQMSLKLTNPMEAAVTNAAGQWNGSLLSSTSSFGSGLSAGLGSSLGSTGGSFGSGLASTGFAGLGEKSAENFFGLSGSSGAGSSASGASAGSGALGIAGKVSAGLGAAIGAYNMYNDIAGFGDHRSASDMLANVGRSHVTTEHGNQYTAYNGVNAGQELAYEKANARSKQLGFGMNALGTGASIGSFFGPIGTAIGAAAGLLLGGLGSLFGWGDNSEEIERLTRLTNDNIANYNRQGEAVARSKDVAAEFNDRQGVATAAEGKNAFGPMTSKKGDNINTPRFVFDINKPNNIGIAVPSSKLMPGETVLNKETSNWAVVPGKGDKDNVYSTVRPGDPNVVYTKKGGISKKALAVLKSNASENLKRWSLNELEKEQSALLMAENNQNDMKKYKNGKLPGYWRGTDYLMSAIPHLAALGASWNLYNRAKYADMPDYPNIVDSGANTEAINILGRRRFNPEPILNMLNDQHRHALYELHRMPGLTAGGQAQAMANLNIKTARAKTEALAQADEINNRYTADYANALANYGKMMNEMMTNNNYARAAFRQQQNAAKEGWMAQYEKNGLTALADLASDIMGVRQFNRSEDYGNRMLKLYDQQVENDKSKIQAELAKALQARPNREAAYNKAAKEAAEKTHPMFLNWGMYRPDGLWNAYGSFNPPTLNVPGILRNPKYMKYGPIGYKDGKGGFVSRGSNLGQFYEEIQPSNLFGIGSNEYSTKMITNEGDTVYQTPNGLFPKEVVRKKGGPNSKEYIKAKQRHDRLLKNATPSNNIGMDQLLRMFGF